MPNNKQNSEANELPSLSTSLLVRVQQMQPAAWTRLTEVFSPIVYRWARQAGLSGDDSADVVQDVFISVARRIPDFKRQKEKASFRSWLATITRNRVRDSYRYRARQPHGEGGTEALERFKTHATELPDDHLPHHDRLDESISLANLNENVPRQVLEIVKRECEPRTWQAFWLTTVQGDAAADVADRLGMSLASVYKSKSRILRRLRARIEELP